MVKRAPQQDWLFLLGLASLGCAVGDTSTTPSPFSAGDFGDGGGGDDDDDDDADTENDGDESPVMDGTTGSNDDGPADGPADDGPADGPGGTTGSMDDAGDAVTSMPNDDAGPLDDAGMDDYGYGSDDGAPVGSPCMAYAANIANCFGGDAMLYEYYCYADLDFYAAYGGPACASAWEELYACIGGVSCMELSAGLGCDPEVAGVQASC